MPKRFEGAEPKVAPLNMKTTATLRAKLEEAARASGRCLTHEALFHVERSLMMDDVASAVRDQISAEFAVREPVSSIPPQAMRQVWSRPAISEMLPPFTVGN